MTLDRFEPAAALRVLAANQVDFVVIGGYAAALHGSPVFTSDTDICPDPDPANLRRLCTALRELDARIRTSTEPEGVAFDCNEDLLVRMSMLNLVTTYGDFDISFRPAGSDGFADLARNAVGFDIGGFVVKVAAIDDIILSKETANRAKDQYGLVHLYALRDEIAARE
ncbi:MAG: hypothetical protein WEC34_05995 [Acidimicrobiia bacterium]